MISRCNKFVKSSTGPGRQLRASANNKGDMTKLEIIRLIRTRIGEISMSMGDYYYLIQKLEELKNETIHNRS